MRLGRDREGQMHKKSITVAPPKGKIRAPRSGVTFALLLIVAFGGMIALVLVQRWGVGTTTDSTYYIDGARHLAAGDGYSHDLGIDEIRPITQWPPLFSCVLAMGALLGIDPLDGALWLNSSLLGVNIFLLGWAVHRHASAARWTSILASFVILTSGPVVVAHSLAWSEPLFLTWSILGALWLASSLSSENRWRLIAAAMAFGAASMTRYIGIALITGALFAIMLHPGRPLARRLKNAAIFGIVAGLPIFLLMVRNLGIDSSQTYYTSLAWRPITLGHLRVTADVLRKVFFCRDVCWAVIIVRLGTIGLGLGLLVAIVIDNLRRNSQTRRGPPEKSSLPFLLAIVILTYLVSLVLSISLIAGNIRLDARALCPAYFLGVALLLLLAHRHLHFRQRAPWLRIGLVAAMAIFVVSSVPFTLPLYLGLTSGQGATAEIWQTNHIIAAIKERPDQPVIYSNEFHAINLLTGKKAYRIPNRHNKGVPNDHLGEEVEAMRQKYRAGNGGLLIYWRIGYYRDYLATEKQLVQALWPVRRVIADDTANVYEIIPARSNGEVGG